MRLIDADDLLTAFPIDDEPMLTKSCVRMTIRRMPTIEERKTGKWIGHKLQNGLDSIDEDTCSECGERFYQIAETGCAWNYCPNCGADMRGGNDD